MTTHNTDFAHLAVTLMRDLSQPSTAEQRYQRLLTLLADMVPCDALALLQLHGNVLQPLAVIGLSEDTLGRRFIVADQPRLARILLSREPVRFTDAQLPDPYDGLVEGGPQHLPVHDCMGVALYVANEPWGALTFDAIEPGSFDGIDTDELGRCVELIAHWAAAVDIIDSLRERIDREHQFSLALLAQRHSQELIGKSPAIAKLRHDITTVAASDLTVLILGETGVGKELVAAQIHGQSGRAAQSMVHVNCAALPETLAESELFGHRRGAFTGAVSDRAGKFELADGGTLLLDEIGELSLSIQAKLLRALQSGDIQRVGDDRPLRVDVRVIAATNRDLKNEVAAGRFRADLYHRLSVFPIVVPPLRERGRDVLTLAGYFLERNQQRLHVRNLRLSAESRQALLDYSWPGNVRELEHLMSRAALLAAADQRQPQRWITIEPRHLGLQTQSIAAASMSPQNAPNTTITFAEAQLAFQKRWLENALQLHGDNLAATARAIGLDRSNLHRLLKKLGVR